MATKTLIRATEVSLNVPVPPGQHSMGLPALDATIQGGLSPGSICLLVADPGDVQEMVCMHFATTGDEVLYVATDRTPADLSAHWEAYGRQGECVLFDEADGALPKGLAGHNRVVIDSFSRHAQAVGWDRAVQQLHALKADLVQNGQAALVVVFPSLHSATELATLGILADGVLEVDVEKTTTTQKASLRVVKMRRVPAAARAFPVTMHRDGLFLEVIKRVL